MKRIPDPVANHCDRNPTAVAPGVLIDLRVIVHIAWVVLRTVSLFLLLLFVRLCESLDRVAELVGQLDMGV